MHKIVSFCVLLSLTLVAIKSDESADDMRVCTKNISTPYTAYAMEKRNSCPTASLCLGNPIKFYYVYKVVTKYNITRTKYCCDGYKGSADNCKPICTGGCSGNRHCVAPEKCECNPGYGGVDCQPICDCRKLEYCKEPGICACIHGYKMNPNSGACELDCSEGCHSTESLTESFSTDTIFETSSELSTEDVSTSISTESSSTDPTFETSSELSPEDVSTEALNVSTSISSHILHIIIVAAMLIFYYI